MLDSARMFAARVRSRWRRRGSGPFAVRYLKGPKDDPIVERAMAEAQTARARELVETATADMERLMDRLGDRPADPHPMSLTLSGTESEAVASCATPPMGGALLYGIVRAVRPRSVVEIGAAHGYGAYYIASALQENGRGRLDTLEGMQLRIELTRETLSRLGVDDRVTVVEGEFDRTFPSVLEGGTVDMVFSDGDKTVDRTRRQFDQALEAVGGAGFLLFDDVNFSRDIERLFAQLVGHPRVARAAVFRGRWALLRLAPRA